MAEAFFSKAKDLVDAYGDVFKLSRTMDTVEQNFNEGLMGASVGQCKNLIESLAKTILNKKNVGYEANIKFTQLVKKAITEISVDGVGNDSKKTHDAFLKIVSGICNSIDNSVKGIAELRNDYCPEGHGRSADHIDLPKEYAEFIILQTDAVICFILSLVQRHKEYQPPIKFEENEDYNTALYDKFGEIEIFGDLYQAPEILFSLHSLKYREKLKEYRSKDGLSYDE